MLAECQPKKTTSQKRAIVKSKAAVLHEFGKPMVIEEVELDGPRENEILVRYTHSGLCHSDLHAIQGRLPARLPMVLGHEGAGIVEEVGIGVTRVARGDHIVCSFVPSCGHCHWCATGQQALCDMGAAILEGNLPGDRFPISGASGSYAAMCTIGTFSQYGVIHETSAIKIDDDLPLGSAALVGCGVPTGWGSAVRAGEVGPSDTVVVIGVGGVGINAVQGARMAGARAIIAVDPVAFKREKATELGATHAVATAHEAHTLALDITRGVGPRCVIITAGLVDSQQILDGFNMLSKGGTIVVTGNGPGSEVSIELPSMPLSMFKKTIRGTIFGDCNPTSDVPLLLNLYRDGTLKLDELITRTYTLDQINEGYEDLTAGELIRGLIVHES